MRAALLMLFALIVMVALFLPLLLIQCVRHAVMKKPIEEVFWNAAIGLDQLGGAMLYGEPDWTVSSRTFWLADQGNRFAGWFEAFINLLFGQGHCRESYESEFGEKCADITVEGGSYLPQDVQRLVDKINQGTGSR